MDSSTLVDSQIEAGQKLVDRLVQEGVPVRFAFWLKEIEKDHWYLYLATPLVGADGATGSAYRRVSEVLHQMGEDYFEFTFRVKAIALSNPLAEYVAEVYRRHPRAKARRYGFAHGWPVH